MRTALTALSVVVTIAGSASPHAADIDLMGDLRVRVRIYDAGGLDPAVLAGAIATASAIFDATGLDVAWIGCDAARAALDPLNPCVIPLTPTELAVRFVRLASATGGRGVALGDSFVDTSTGRGTLATVYLNRVDGVGNEFRGAADVLLGRAVAHEVGHLLMGTTAHANVGLMTPVWSQEVLRRDRSGDWFFTPKDARAIRDRVRARALLAPRLVSAQQTDDPRAGERRP